MTAKYGKPNANQGSLMSSMRVIPQHPWRPSELPNLTDVYTLAADYETTGLRWWAGDKPVGLALAWYDDPRDPENSRIHSFYLPYRHAGGNIDEDKALAWQREQLQGKRLLWANAPFDLHNGQVDGIDFEAMGCSVSDIIHRAALLDDNRRRFGLDSLSREYLGEGKKELPEGYIKIMGELHAGQVEGYARHDAELVLRLDSRMEPMIVEQELEDVLALEENCIFPTVEMERNGTKLDVEKLERWCNESELICLRLQQDVRKEVGFPVSHKDRESLSRMFRHLGLVNPFKTAVKGEESFTDAILEQFDHPTVKKVQLWREYESMRVKFLLNYRAKVDSNGILRYALHQMANDEGGTVSGRYSSSGLNRQEGVNIQQVTKPSKQKLNAKRIEELKKSIPYLKCFVIRELFIPGTPNYHWLSADAKQIEYRLFGHFSKAKKVLEAYARDPETDFHNLVMEMVQRTKPINRDRTKDLNFAKIYGAGLKKVAIMLGFRSPTEPEHSMVGVAQVKEFVEAYDAEFPEARLLLKEAASLAEKRGWVKTILGRRARFPAGFTHKALNRVIQGSAADINKQKLIELHEARKQTGFIMRFTVHDEVNGDCPDEASMLKVKTILDTQSFDLRVPILWDIGIGPNWKDA